MINILGDLGMKLFTVIPIITVNQAATFLIIGFIILLVLMIKAK